MNLNSKIIIRQETSADFFIVENLTREAFWNVYRPGCLEHYVLHCYRNRPEFIPELSLVMELCHGNHRELIAHVMFSWSQILLDNNESVPIMTFGPLSVRPDMQRKGYGKILLEHAMAKAKLMDGKCLAICGNIQFYGKCGFVTATSKGIRYADDPNGDAPYFLIKELEHGFLDKISGSYKDPIGYFVDEAECEVFDRQFPPKEKLKLPGQLC